MTMEQMHKNAHEAAAAFESQVRFTTASGQPWYGALFHIGPDGLLRMERTTCEFPMGRIGEALDLMRRDATHELGLDHSPLPPAPGFGIVNDDDGDLLPQPASVAAAIGE